MNLDFNPPNRGGKHSKRKFFRPLVWGGLGTVILVAVLATYLWEPVTPTEARIAPPEITAPPAAASAPAPAPASEPEPEPEIRSRLLTGEIQPGDTITSLLGDYFTPQEIHRLNQASHDVFPLSRICAGQPFKICLTGEEFERFEYDIDRDDQLVIEADEEGFEVSRVPIDYQVTTERVEGSIDSSLFETVTEIGEEPELAIALADIFAWDIDFIRDIRAGDSFRVLVEKRFREGDPAGYGRILAVEFVNQGKTYTAYRFQDGDQPPAYYDRDGGSLRKAFLRAPLAFTRISSGFSLRRYHPIAKTWRAHPAIDYAAPTGTPIRAIGDGTIIRIGRTKGNGNYIKLRHTNGIESMYLHMNRFARGMKRNRRVTQGDVIGYVGSTGLATGPHLCFRMYKNGSPINPAKLKSASGDPVSKPHLEEFRSLAANFSTRLEGRKAVAELSSPPASR